MGITRIALSLSGKFKEGADMELWYSNKEYIACIHKQ